MSAARTKRRPKPVQFPLRTTLRFDEEFRSLVDRTRRALARQRQVDVEAIDFSTAVRTLVTKQFEAASALADQPSSWPASNKVELPDELWDALTECRNRLSHSQGSLYLIMRKINTEEHPITEEIRAAVADVRASKLTLDRLEARLIETASILEAGADAEGGGSRY